MVETLIFSDHDSPWWLFNHVLEFGVFNSFFLCKDFFGEKPEFLVKVLAALEVFLFALSWCHKA